MKKMLASKELYGRYFATNRDSLRQLTTNRGHRYLANRLRSQVFDRLRWPGPIFAQFNFDLRRSALSAVEKLS